MKKLIQILMVAMACMLSLPSAIAQQDFVPDEVVVSTYYPVMWDSSTLRASFDYLLPVGSKVVQCLDKSVIVQDENLERIGKFYGSVFLIKLPDTNAISIIAENISLFDHSVIKRIEHELIGFEHSSSPPSMNDPGFSLSQNHLKYDPTAVGIIYTGVQHIWGYAYKNTSKIIIAVLDAGLNFNHQDIQNAWYTSITDPINGVDDDLNGYIDDYRGWDFVNNDNDPTDDNNISHGSNVAGIIGARQNNNQGIAGIITDTGSMLILKVADNVGTVTTSTTTAAYYYALSKGARVINMSFGFSSQPSALMTAIAIGVSTYNAVPVASVGNTGGLNYQWPASGENVLTVGAANSAGSNWASTSYSDSLDVMARGVSMISLSATINNGSSNLSGTSQAAPIISSYVWGILKANPTLTVVQVIQKIRNQGINGSFQAQSGFGYVRGMDTMYHNDMMPDTNITFTACTGMQPLPPVHCFNIIDSVRYGNTAISGHSINTNLLLPGVYYYKMALKMESPPGGYYLDTFQTLKLTIIGGSGQLIPITTANAPSTACANTNFTVSRAGNTTGATGTWYRNGAAVGSGVGLNLTQNLPAGSYAYYFVADMATTGTCWTKPYDTSNTVTVNVQSSIAPSVSISVNPSNTICQGSGVIFSALPNNAGTNPDFQWKVNGGNAGSNSNTYSTAALNNNDVVTCVLTVTSSGCFSSTTATSNPITMTVSTPVAPLVVTSITTGSNPMCVSSPLTFTAIPTNGGATPSYNWEKWNGAAWVSQQTGSSATFTPTGVNNNDQYRVTLTTSLGCVTATSASSTVTTMTVNSVLIPVISITANPSGAICAGTSVIFTATPTNGGSVPSYQWKVNGVNQGTNSSTYSYVPVNGDIVTCVLTSNASCASPLTATSNAIPISVNPNVTPTITITANPSGPICQGTSVTFTAAITNGGSVPSYQWKKNGGNVGTNSSVYNDAGLVTTDVVTCVLTGNAACASSATAISAGLSVTVDPFITPVVSLSGPNSAAFGSSVTITASVTNAPPGYSLDWKNHGTSFSITSVPSVTYTKPAGVDTVTATITTTSGCYNPATSGAHYVTIITTGTGNFGNGEGVFVYPNPFEDKITVKGLKKEDRLMLLDMVGRQVSETIIIRSDKEEEVLSLGGLAAGNYLLCIVDKNGKVRVNVAVSKR